MSTEKIQKKLIRRYVGEIPLIISIIEKMGLSDILERFIPQGRREEISPKDILTLLIVNLTIGKKPLYELDEWVNSLDLRCLGFNKDDWNLTDDRFGRVLDRLYEADRSSLMTEIVVTAIKKFNVDLNELHNDSTTVKAFGKYNGKTDTGFVLKRGKSKDFRPDLKQLVYSLTISKDGAVPVHFKAYPGNTTDETTHIETWDTLRSIKGDSNFLYVADCKVCTDKQLIYIQENGGNVVTMIPEKWKEVKSFKASLREGTFERKEIWRRENCEGDTDYFYLYKGEHFTLKRNYRIHWIYSSSKGDHDRYVREDRMKKAEKMLQKIEPQLNKRKLKTKEAIADACKKILKKHAVEKFINIDIGESREESFIHPKGRPKKNEEPRKIIKSIYTLSWARNKESLEKEKKVDGVFPLLSTDKDLSAKDALIAYKYQPKLEKRFHQFKSVHNAAPLFCKKVERIEANMFIFFIALMIQALIEREIRLQMKNGELASLAVYPEDREATHPTTSKVFDVFGQIFTYKIVKDNVVIEEYEDELKEIQLAVIKLMNIEERKYWGKKGRVLAKTHY